MDLFQLELFCIMLLNDAYMLRIFTHYYQSTSKDSRLTASSPLQARNLFSAYIVKVTYVLVTPTPTLKQMTS